MSIFGNIEGEFLDLASDLVSRHYEKERRRDQDYIQGVIDEKKLLERNAEAYRNTHASFLKQFRDPFIEEIMPYLAFAQEETKEAYGVIAEKKNVYLNKEQHPTLAGVCDSGRNNQFAFGKNGEALGEMLALQQPDGVIVYHPPVGEKTLTFAAASFFELVQMKHIQSVTLIKDSHNPFIEAAYYHYAKENGKKSALHGRIDVREKEFVEDQFVKKYIKESRTLYKTVARNIKESGFDYYESLLGDKGKDQSFLNNSNRRYNELARSDKDRPSLYDARFIRAMQMQQVLWDQEVLKKHGYGADQVMTVFQGRLTGRQYLWNPTKAKFVRIPDVDKENSVFAAEQERFEKNFSEDAVGKETASSMMSGARQYRRFLALEAAANKEKILQKNNPSIVSCSDSRTPRSSIVRTGADLLGTAEFRNPGAFVSRCGEMMSDAGRFFAFTRLKKQPIILSPHAVCGAEEIIDSYFAGKDAGKIPEGFQHVAKHRQELVETVLRGGKPLESGEVERLSIDETRARYEATNKDEIIDIYRKKTGVNLQSLADCFSVQQLLMDAEVAKRDYPTVPCVVLFQNVSECRNYIYNPRKEKFLPIPTSNETFPVEPSKKVKQAAQMCFKTA